MQTTAAERERYARDASYLRWRRSGYLAQNALYYARAEVAASSLTPDEDYRLVWECDWDLDVNCFYGYPEPEQTRLTEELVRNLQDGVWEALGCRVYVPRTCDHCGSTIADEWQDAASLWGIVVETGRGSDEYRRSIELDLLTEAGVI